MASFVALDFETANNSRDSACALAVVRVDDGRVVEERYRLIRPPTPSFLFTGIHGITWRHVKDEPTFDGAWPHLAELIEGVDFLVAHNAPFDRGVLRACCARYGLAEPQLPWLDTVRAAKKRWGLPRNRLPDVWVISLCPTPECQIRCCFSSSAGSRLWLFSPGYSLVSFRFWVGHFSVFL